jgi:hypothetical protein
MIRVSTSDGKEHVYDGEQLEFESEDVTGHLLVTTESVAALFASGAWTKLEMDRGQ